MQGHYGLKLTAGMARNYPSRTVERVLELSLQGDSSSETDDLIREMTREELEFLQLHPIQLLGAQPAGG